MIYLGVVIRPDGIIAIRRYPSSKMRSAFIFPPPSTFIGALVYSIQRVLGDRRENLIDSKPKGKGRSFVERYKDLFVGVFSSFSIRPIAFGSLSRIVRFYRGTVDFSVTSHPFAVYYTSSNVDPLIKVVYLINEKKMESLDLDKDDLFRSGWGISRLGSRESTVSVDEVVLDSVELNESRVDRENAFEVSFSFEYRRDLKWDGNFSVLKVANWREGMSDYSEVDVINVIYPVDKVKVWGDLRFFDTKFGRVIV